MIAKVTDNKLIPNQISVVLRLKGKDAKLNKSSHSDKT